MKVEKKEEKEENPNFDKNMTSKRLQLWSNSTNSEYAIRFEKEPDILAATNKEIESIEFTNLVEEADYLEDLKYDWEYTLKHWTNNRYYHYDNNSMDSESSSLLSPNYQTTKEEASFNSSNYYEEGDTDKKFDSKRLTKECDSKFDASNTNKRVGFTPNSSFKCHFCKLAFRRNIQRKGHELAWHPNSINNRNSNNSKR